jgi:uncharacterized membrane protein
MRQAMLLSQCKYQVAASMETRSLSLMTNEFPSGRVPAMKPIASQLRELAVSRFSLYLRKSAGRNYSYYFVALEVKNKNEKMTSCRLFKNSL